MIPQEPYHEDRRRPGPCRFDSEFERDVFVSLKGIVLFILLLTLFWAGVIYLVYAVCDALCDHVTRPPEVDESAVDPATYLLLEDRRWARSTGGSGRSWRATTRASRRQSATR